jgi:hypothetical protein
MRLKHDKGVRASLDAMAAMCLLERYIEDEAEGAIEALPCTYPIPRALNNFNYDIVRKYIRDLHWSDPPSRKDLKGVVSPVRKKTEQKNILSEEEEGEEEEEEEDEDEDEEKCVVSLKVPAGPAVSNQQSNLNNPESLEGLSADELQTLLRARRRKKGTLKSLHHKS